MLNNTKLNNQPIIKKINELYITERKSYLLLSKKGTYVTLIKGKNTSVALNDRLIQHHLEGKKTIGVFSGEHTSRFICFDFDMIDKTQLKWITLQALDILNELGFSDSDIHLADSGNKGLHLLLFSDKVIPLTYFKKLFIIVMQKLQDNLPQETYSKLHKSNELTLEIPNICNIEFRPNGVQGVKLELGINYRNTTDSNNKCLFMDKSTFELIEDMDYFLNITPTDHNIIKTIVDDNEEDTLKVEVVNEGVELVKENIKESHAHTINRDEDETIEHIKDLLINGMKTNGSRHTSTFKISRYLKYMGLELDETIEELKEWMIKQDKKYYNSTLEDALSECERIAKLTYEKGYTLVSEIKNLHIYKDEMLQIMKIKDKNSKILLFSMILHSKRYSSQNGSFYMTYAQMEEMCGISRTTGIKLVNKLEEMGTIEIVDRDITQKGTHKKRPNKYKINIKVDDLTSVLEIDNSNNKLDYTDLYFKSIITLLDNSEVRHLPEKQYTEIRKYRKLAS